MSREAIAAALARDDLSCGERLVAFSLASFADRENRARPGTPAAAARAGLARSRFLEARDRLVRRGLVDVEQAAAGRGRASTLLLRCAELGPWWEGEINAELFEAVLGYSRSRGPARLLLAVMAALADEQGVVDGVTTERLRAAAGIADRTYRRARTALLASGEVVLRGGSGGRGHTNCWEVPNPCSRMGATPPARGRRVPPPAGARPLMATAAMPVAGEGQDVEAVPTEIAADVRGRHAGDVKGGQDRTVSTRKGPALTGVSEAKGGQDRTLPGQNRPVLTGVSAVKGGQDRTVSGDTPAETPAETPAPNARAAREPQNPRTTDPPNPPDGGSLADWVLVEQTHVTDRGRTRQRMVPVDLGAVRARLRAAGEADRAAWEEIRAVLLGAVGESTFEIWLAPLDLIAVDLEGTLVVSAPPETVGWVARRFGRVLDSAAERAGRRLRVAAELERQAAESPSPTTRAGPADLSARRSVERACGFRTDGPSGRLGDTSADGSADPSSYTDVYNQLEVS
jgi:DnaA N-terminal domain